MGVPEREKRENSGSEMIQKNRYIFEYGRQAFLNLKSQPNAEHKWMRKVPHQDTILWNFRIPGRKKNWKSFLK